ncbi:hypothetical protein LTR28_009491 [Elasticomyces elasticus]|nr:hypothetical protein LTR28_009491 [Elasticomyces elasticus]
MTPPGSSSATFPRRDPGIDRARQASRETEIKGQSLRSSTSDASDVFSDLDFDASPSASLREPRRPSRYSFAHADLPSPNYQTSVHDFATRTLQSPLQEPRRYADAKSALPNSRYTEKSKKPSSLQASVIVQEASSARSPSGTPFYPPSPPRSPRLVADRSRDTTTPRSSPRSVAGSAEGSRPASPRSDGRSPRLSFVGSSSYSSSFLPQSDTAWDEALAANEQRRTKPPSRLASSMRQESVPVIQRTDHGSRASSRPSATLPYPDDDLSHLMPSEQGYQPIPGRQPSEPTVRVAKAASRAVSPLPTTPTFAKRPSFPARHSAADAVPSSKCMRQSSWGGTSQTRQQVLSVSASTLLPPCPRSECSNRYDDWYTLDGCPGFNICPDCLNVFAATPYGVFFKRASRRPAHAQVVCDFSSPWMRLAWLMTLQQQRPGLELMQALARLSEAEQPCPDDKEGTRPWYGIRDYDGFLLRNFQLCLHDVRRVEVLMPSLRGLFVRISSPDQYQPRQCSFRVKSQRFSPYLDALIAVHDKALRDRRNPDPSPFIALVRHKSTLQECTRDDLLIGQLWHYTPSLPDFTICQDCYDTVVYPSLAANSDIAMRFNRALQPVHTDAERRLGSSCQLYSPRMRRVWRHAVDTNDLRYLQRKAKERKEVEIELHERVAAIKRLGRRIPDADEWRSGWEEAEKRRLERALKDVSDEWARWE